MIESTAEYKVIVKIKNFLDEDVLREVLFSIDHGKIHLAINLETISNIRKNPQKMQLKNR